MFRFLEGLPTSKVAGKPPSKSCHAPATPDKECGPAPCGDSQWSQIWSPKREGGGVFDSAETGLGFRCSGLGEFTLQSFPA